MQQKKNVVYLVADNACRYTRDERVAVEAARFWLSRTTDPRDVCFFVNEDGTEVAAFTKDDEARVTLTKMRGEFVAGDNVGNILARGKSLRAVLIKALTGCRFPSEASFLNEHRG